MREPNPLLGAYGKDVWRGPHFNYTFSSGAPPASSPAAVADRDDPVRRPVLHVVPNSARAVKQTFDEGCYSAAATHKLLPLMRVRRHMPNLHDGGRDGAEEGPHGTLLQNGAGKAGASKRGQRSGLPLL